MRRLGFARYFPFILRWKFYLAVVVALNNKNTFISLNRYTKTNTKSKINLN
jgi:hypothetical protein